MRGSGARLVTTAIVADSRFPFPQSLQKSGNSNREVHFDYLDFATIKLPAPAYMRRRGSACTRLWPIVKDPL